MTQVKPAKRRLDQLLVELDYFEDLRTAVGWIMAGKVVVDGAVVTTAGKQVSPLADIHIRGMRLKFASRGGYKLEHALRRFAINVSGLVCLDGGASAGGFTDCLLQNGARKVYAVDVGFGQLRGKLATDPRVVNWERTNISDVDVNVLSPALDFACADLSYLSLRRAVGIVGNLFRKSPRIVFLLKPLYEGLAEQDKADILSLNAVVTRLIKDLADAGTPPSDATVSPILGGRGAVEFLLDFGGVPRVPDKVVARAFEDLGQQWPVGISEYMARQEVR